MMRFLWNICKTFSSYCGQFGTIGIEWFMRKYNQILCKLCLQLKVCIAGTKKHTPSVINQTEAGPDQELNTPQRQDIGNC